MIVEGCEEWRTKYRSDINGEVQDNSTFQAKIKNSVKVKILLGINQFIVKKTMMSDKITYLPVYLTDSTTWPKYALLKERFLKNIHHTGSLQDCQNYHRIEKLFFHIFN